MANDLTVLDKALILSYIHADQLKKSLETVLVEMEAVNDERAGRFQSCLEKLQGAANRAFANVEKNIENKPELENDLWDLIGESWDAVKETKY